MVRDVKKTIIVSDASQKSIKSKSKFKSQSITKSQGKSTSSKSLSKNIQQNRNIYSTNTQKQFQTDPPTVRSNKLFYRDGKDK